jgi:zinc transporter ZupT
MFSSSTSNESNTSAEKCIGTCITMTLFGTTMGVSAIAHSTGFDQCTSIVIGLGGGFAAPVGSFIACALAYSCYADHCRGSKDSYEINNDENTVLMTRPSL